MFVERLYQYERPVSGDFRQRYMKVKEPFVGYTRGFGRKRKRN